MRSSHWLPFLRSPGPRARRRRSRPASARSMRTLLFLERLASRTLLSFAAASTYNVGTGPGSVIVGDFNGDGVPDLAVANYSSDDVSVLLGNGDGSFQAARNFAAGHLPSAVAVADFNGDGHQDLVVADNGGGVSVLLGNGDGLAEGSYVARFAVPPNGPPLVRSVFHRRRGRSPSAGTGKDRGPEA